MKKDKVIGQATLPSNVECKVVYHERTDMVDIAMGGTTLTFKTDSFMMMHEVLRKAAARIVMQTPLTLLHQG